MKTKNSRHVSFLVQLFCCRFATVLFLGLAFLAFTHCVLSVWLTVARQLYNGNQRYGHRHYLFMFFMTTKPQPGICLCVYLIAQAYKLFNILYFVCCWLPFALSRSLAAAACAWVRWFFFQYVPASSIFMTLFHELHEKLFRIASAK